MFSSRGKQLLMVDADGATKFSDLTKVQNNLHKIINGKVCMYYYYFNINNSCTHDQLTLWIYNNSWIQFVKLFINFLLHDFITTYMF